MKTKLLALFLFVAAQAAAAPTGLFLTWTSDPLTTMTVRWLAPHDDRSDTVSFRELDDSAEWKQATVTSQPLPDKHPFLFHDVTLSGLNPGTSYLFRIENDEKDYRFKTMPASLTEPIRFVVGGDMYHDEKETLAATNLQAAATSPHFALLGGDLAYSAPKFSFFYEEFDRWLVWLKAWNLNMITPEGNLIPLVSCIGNHEVCGRYGQSPAQAIFFYLIFGTPEKTAYRAVDFGDYMSIVLLDSNHTAPIKGIQENWLKETLTHRQEIPNVFAAYHVPAYPSVRKYSSKVSKRIRQSWVPLFEELGVNAAFEHHDHAYKRTYPLYQGKKNDERGVLYLGDGAWGIEHPRQHLYLREKWYIEKFKSARHFILVNVSQSGRCYTAIDSNGLVIDRAHR